MRFLIILGIISLPLFAGDWWNENWNCRKKVEFSFSPGKFSYSPPVGWVAFSTGGEVREDGGDIRVMDKKGEEIPYQLIYSSPYTYTLIAFPLTPGEDTYYIYFGNPRASPPRYNWRLRAGLILETLKKPPGGAWKWKDYQRLLRRSEKIYGVTFWGRIFDAYNPFGPSDNYLSIYRGYFYAPRKGEYYFATASDDASFVFVDGKLVTQWGGFHRAGGGRRAEYQGSIFLAPGVHYLEYYHLEGRGDQAAVLYWKKPSDKNFRVMESRYFLPVVRGRVVGFEKLDNPYPADFSWVLESNLRVDHNIFTLVTFFSSSSEGYLSWDLGEGREVEGKSVVEHVFLSSGDKKVRLRRKVWVYQLRDGKEIRGYPIEVNPDYYRVRVLGGTETLKRKEVVDIREYEDEMVRVFTLPDIFPERIKEDTQKRMERYLEILKTYPLRKLSSSSLKKMLLFYRVKGEKRGEAEVLRELARRRKGKERDETLYSLAKLYRDMGYLREAQKTLELIESRDFQPKAYFTLGSWLLEEGKREEALLYFEKLKEEDESLYHLAMGDFFLREGKLDEARKEYEKVKVNNPSPPEGFYLHQAEYYLRKKEWEKLEELLEEWGITYPLSRMNLIPFYRGWLYLRKGDRNKALREWDILLKWEGGVLVNRVKKVLGKK